MCLHVVHGGGGEGASERLFVAELRHADDGVGDRGADVRAEDHRDGVTNLDAGRHEGDDDRRRRRRRLDENLHRKSKALKLFHFLYCTTSMLLTGTFCRLKD